MYLCAVGKLRTFPFGQYVNGYVFSSVLLRWLVCYVTIWNLAVMRNIVVYFICGLSMLQKWYNDSDSILNFPCAGLTHCISHECIMCWMGE